MSHVPLALPRMIFILNLLSLVSCQNTHRKRWVFFILNMATTKASQLIFKRVLIAIFKIT